MILSLQGADLQLFKRPARRDGDRAYLVGGAIASGGRVHDPRSAAAARLQGAYNSRVLFKAFVALRDLSDRKPEGMLDAA